MLERARAHAVVAAEIIKAAYQIEPDFLITPTRVAVPQPNDSTAWWRHGDATREGTVKIHVTDRLLHQLGTGIAPKLNASFSKRRGNPVIVYGTTGAGKTRLMLEHLYTHWGYYLPAARAGGKCLLQVSVQQVREKNFRGMDAQLTTLLPVVCRALVLERLRQLDFAAAPREWLYIQLQSKHTAAFLNLLFQLQQLQGEYNAWVEVTRALHARFSKPPCICVDEAQELLRIPIFFGKRLRRGVPGLHSAYGAVARIAWRCRVDVILAGVGMAPEEVVTQYRRTGAGDGRPKEKPAMLRVGTVLGEREIMEYLERTLQVHAGVLRQRHIMEALRCQVRGWFEKARPRFVARLADELELLFRHAKSHTLTHTQQRQAIADAAGTAVWFLTHRLSKYFTKRNDRHPVPRLAGLLAEQRHPVRRLAGLLAERLAAFQCCVAPCVFSDRRDDSEAMYQMVESGFVSVGADGCLSEPIAARALSDWLGANRPMAHLVSVLRRQQNESAQGFVFVSLTCASISAQFQKAALAATPSCAWNVHACPPVPRGNVPWVTALFPDFDRILTHVRLVGVGDSHRLMVREAVTGMSVRKFLRKPMAPFLLPGKHAGPESPDVVFQLAFTGTGTDETKVNVFLQCKLRKSSVPTWHEAWHPAEPSVAFMCKRMETPKVSFRLPHPESKRGASKRCLGGHMSPAPCPEAARNAITTGLHAWTAVCGDALMTAMDGELPARPRPCYCPTGCGTRRCGCRRRGRACLATCACQHGACGAGDAPVKGCSNPRKRRRR